MPIWLWVVIAIVAAGGGFFAWKKFAAKGENSNDTDSVEASETPAPEMSAEVPEAPAETSEPESTPETPAPEVPATPESPSSEEEKPM